MQTFKILALITCLTAFADIRDMKKAETNLQTSVVHLSKNIGARSYRDIEKLNRTADYIEERFRFFKCETKRQSFKYDNRTYYNIEAEVKGTSKDKEIIVIGAHYDTVSDTPGADDNASGIAGILELARLISENPLPETVRLVAFTLEEPPFFRTKKMGSYVYAESLKKEKAKVRGMISLEMLGYFCDKEGCQYYPLPFFKWFYPKKGNFLSFVGDIGSRRFTLKMKKAFKKVSSLPVESINTVSLVPGIDFSDHRSFWKFGYDAFMITDTAFYRNPEYHGMGDTAETLDYKRMAEFIKGLYNALDVFMKESR